MPVEVQVGYHGNMKGSVFGFYAVLEIFFYRQLNIFREKKISLMKWNDVVFTSL